ncbi:MAG: Fic family protein [Lachnospiraceae bacterium]|nr:Fic family protein [Lachnospiraceae bacterium]
MSESMDKRYLDTVKKWRERNITTVADLDAALSDFRILYAYHSNKLEGAGLDLLRTREIFDDEHINDYSGSLIKIFEVQNQKDCYEYLKYRIADKEPVSTKLIKKIHGILNHDCYDEARWKKGERPGEYKVNHYGVAENAGVPPEDVADEMEYLCGEINSVDTDDPIKLLKAASFFHCNFEYIHGFADGNGRAGRTLLNYYLMINNMPPAIIYEEDKATYYMALAVFDRTENMDGFVQMMKEVTVKTWEKRVRKPSLSNLTKLLE